MKAYLICGTPRTGSTLLCSLLQSTGVAGVPESYFRSPDENALAQEWGVQRTPDGQVDFAGFLQAAKSVGSTDNGVFAARIMWGTMDEVVSKLAALHPNLTGNAGRLVQEAFGHTQYVYIYRKDALAQAVSWTRAEQTGFWHATDNGSQSSDTKPHYDFEQIRQYLALIEAHNAEWRRWFATSSIQPHVVQYEYLAHNPVGAAASVLDFLRLDLPEGRRIVARNRRLADQLSSEWIRQFRLDQDER